MARAEAELEKAVRRSVRRVRQIHKSSRPWRAVEQANRDLQRTTVLAPSEGGVTNLSLAIGQGLAKGEAAMTYSSLAAP